MEEIININTGKEMNRYLNKNEEIEEKMSNEIIKNENININEFIDEENSEINSTFTLGNETTNSIKKENLLVSNEVICPICKEKILININEYKITLFGCKNNHNIKIYY